jgi:hypothetical protein
LTKPKSTEILFLIFRNYFFSIQNVPDVFFEMPLTFTYDSTKNLIIKANFSFPNHELKLFRCLFDTSQVSHNFHELKLLKKTIMILLIHGGDFAGCVFQNGKPILHKTFSKYITRKKQGKKQSNQDKESRTKSAGSHIRRNNEEKFNEKVKLILNEWEKHISASSLIFIHIPGANKDLLKETPLDPTLENSKKLRSLPFQTGTPNHTQTVDAFEKLNLFEISY